MNDFVVPSITLLYAGAGFIAILGFIPTLKDLFIHKRNRANPTTSFIWGITNGIALLYGIFVVRDFLFSVVSAISCICFFSIAIMSFYLSKKGISYVSPTL